MAASHSTTNSDNSHTSSRCNSKLLNLILIVVMLLQSVLNIVLHEKYQSNITESTKTSHDGNDAGQKAITEDRQLPFAFSACLLIKDSNIILPEWLAYHYTILPLRRLIVAVDPMSHTDPTPILHSYESIGMNITVWTNNSYWIDGMYAHEKKDFPITNATHEELFNRYKYRQKIFYKSCLQHLRDELRTWTLLVDTDEYLAFNYYDENEGPPTMCKKNDTCAEEYLNSIKNGMHIRTRLDRSPAATVAQHITRHVDTLFDTVDKPCIIFSRYLFVSKEMRKVNRTDEIQSQSISPGFNASLFHTFRYRYRSPLSSYQMGKSIVDVSRYDGRDITNAHRPLGDMCSGYNAYVHNAAMPFRVHHYVGSWESFRQPGFDIRGKSVFNKRNKEKNLVVDNTTPRFSVTGKSNWLAQFVKIVGREKALELTQRLRTREEMKMDRLIREMSGA